MTQQWFTADLHIGHPYVAKLRGFDSPYDLTYHIENQWWSQVDPKDTVWVLGDVVGRSSEDNEALALLKTLPGTKHLIMGNHDSVSSVHRNGYRKQKQWFEVFDSIQHFQRLRTGNTTWLMSHYPYAESGEGQREDAPTRYTQFRLPDEGLPLVHGHTHADHPTRYSKTGREYCVSWDAHNRLVSRGEIDKWIGEL